MLLALQMLSEICLLLGSTVAHGAVELSAGSHTHGQVPGDALPRSGVVVRPLERGEGEKIRGKPPTPFTLTWNVCKDLQDLHLKAN